MSDFDRGMAGTISWIAVLLLVAAIISTPFTARYINRVNDYEESQLKYQDIQLKKKFFSDKQCDQCLESPSNLLSCQSQIDFNQSLTEKCLDSTGPCPAPKTPCTNEGNCCAYHRKTCQEIINNNLCYINTVLRYVALIDYQYFNNEFNRRIDLTKQEIFDNLESYQQFRDNNLNYSQTIYYRKGDPFDLIDRRDLSTNEKALIGSCFVCWFLGFCLAIVAICYHSSIPSR